MMKLSTKSRYGTRLILDLAEHHNQSPVQLGEIAKRQNISLKYLEQIIRPLKKAGYITSFRGAKGGHILSKAPDKISVGEIVALLEGGATLIHCAQNPADCERVDTCLTRYLWMEASNAMYERLTAITFADLIAMQKGECKNKFIDQMAFRGAAPQEQINP
jgi:Rrf2 family transcriptional regulator, iron-sulfur cluster assembly transcription factor